MNEAIFHNLQMLYLLWAIPVLIGIYYYAGHKRNQALKRFAETGLLKRINTSIDYKKRRRKAIIIIIAFIFIVLAMCRPAWNPKPRELERYGRDVVFVLDVSRSMLAEDLAPNRLERAKLAIKDCLEIIQGDRVSLVIFSGTALVKCPLTLDYGFFRMMLEDVSTNSISRGGTMIGDAVRKVIDEVYDDKEKTHKDIILITDGEDQESFPKEAAEAAGKRGIRIIAIGLGDENQGRRIPVTDEQGRKTFLKYKGEEVWSKLDAETLRQMVASSSGKYLNVATGTFDLGEVYLKLIATAEKKKLEAKTMKRYEEKFQLFLGIAIILLATESLLVERRQKRKAKTA